MFSGTCCTVLRLPVLDGMSSCFWTYNSWGPNVRAWAICSILKAVVWIQQVSCPDALTGTLWRNKGGGRRLICSEPPVTHPCPGSLEQTAKMNHFSYLFLWSACPCTACSPVSHDQVLMLEIMATCESPSFVPIFHFLHCPQSKTCRGVHSQACRPASAPGGCSAPCLLQG